MEGVKKKKYINGGFGKEMLLESQYYQYKGIFTEWSYYEFRDYEDSAGLASSAELTASSVTGASLSDVGAEVSSARAGAGTEDSWGTCGVSFLVTGGVTSLFFFDLKSTSVSWISPEKSKNKHDFVPFQSYLSLDWKLFLECSEFLDSVGTTSWPSCP